mmetsp:Transcript_48581/g.156407  ORF Transcript_48581/g.156407 Transcript_48581/m.156407 type:complete len:224 (-) Transcript_48581:85-756(-)
MRRASACRRSPPRGACRAAPQTGARGAPRSGARAHRRCRRRGGGPHRCRAQPRGPPRCPPAPLRSGRTWSPQSLAARSEAPSRRRGAPRCSRRAAGLRWPGGWRVGMEEGRRQPRGSSAGDVGGGRGTASSRAGEDPACAGCLCDGCDRWNRQHKGRSGRAAEREDGRPLRVQLGQQRGRAPVEPVARTVRRGASDGESAAEVWLQLILEALGRRGVRAVLGH